MNLIYLCYLDYRRSWNTFGIQNVLPVIFNMRIKNYFYATFLGLVPTIFIICSIGKVLKIL